MRNRKIEKTIDELLEKLFSEANNDITIKSKSFHITIVKNSTGEKLVDEDTNCICGGYSLGIEDGITMGFCDGKGGELLAACSSAKKAISDMTSRNPIAKLLFNLGD